MFFTGVTDWQGRLLISDRAHIGKIDYFMLHMHGALSDVGTE